MATGAKLIADIKEKSFGEEALFDGLRFEVPAGQVVALIGPSGVGKSTLLRMIGGIDPDYEGDILIDDLVPADAEVPGFVFQDPRLLPWETALGNLLAVKPDLADDEGRQLLVNGVLRGKKRGSAPRVSEHSAAHTETVCRRVTERTRA